ncbi:Plasmodium vivax Vir protein, putative [Plasmodium ovale]|uniref:Plasmodium vivax Vir protein, putative n=1 Tax=Plasmodium ovale TaxID=36330 RepID=A0A1C3KI29_PLAOA|nr:Plasmodium vivax Vir protein, putative [Plasmodium ovale]
MQTGLNIDGLLSNTYKDQLLKGTNFAQLEKGELNSHQANGIRLLNELNLVLRINYYNIKKKCSKESDPKCCRDINYYLDLVTAFIKKSNNDNIDQKELIDHVENYWREIFEKRDNDCQRILDEESIRKRCILKQLHDYCDDKKDIVGKEVEYNDYLKEKWDKIISFNTVTNDDLYFKIKDWNNNESFNYKEFLLTPKGDCSHDYKKVILSHISLFKGKPTTEVMNKEVVSDVHADAAIGKSEDKGREERQDSGEGVRLSRDFGGATADQAFRQPGPEEGEREAEGDKLSLPLLQTPLSAGFSVVGAVFFLFFLYKFSPVGPWISTLIKNNPGEKRGTSDDESFLFLNNPEHNDHYISYNSISH